MDKYLNYGYPFSEQFISKHCDYLFSLIFKTSREQVPIVKSLSSS